MLVHNSHTLTVEIKISTIPISFKSGSGVTCPEYLNSLLSSDSWPLHWMTQPDNQKMQMTHYLPFTVSGLIKSFVSSSSPSASCFLKLDQ